MNFKFITTIRINLKCILVKGKKSDPKDYIFCDCIYTIFWKGKFFGTELRSILAKRFGEGGEIGY